ncbi:MAG: hypothetical protein ACE5E5_09455 [Phycisphaerae bacterium]
MIGNPYLNAEYWIQKKVAEKQVHRDAKAANVAFGTSKMYPVFQTLFERLYVMRVQVFHGASTKGSKLNRNTLRGCVFALQTIMPAIIQVMLDHGTCVDWGEVCFAPQ